MKNISIIILSITILVGCIIGCNPSQDVNKKTIATVNGYTICFQELSDFLNHNRSYTYQYFNDKYDAEYDEKFWEKSFSGEIPETVIKDITLEQLVKIKIEQSLALHKGIINEIDYDMFLKEFTLNNELRRKKLSDNEVVYGPSQYDKHSYFTYRYNNMIGELLEALAIDELEITEEELIDFYEANKEYLYNESNKVTYLDVVIKWDDNQYKEDALIQANEIRNKMQAEDIDEFSNLDLGHIEINSEIMTMDISNNMKNLISSKESILKQMSTGEVSELIKEETSYYIMKVIEIKPNYLSFEQVKSNVKSLLLNEKYEAYINRLIEEANIEIDKKVLGEIKLK